MSNDLLTTNTHVISSVVENIQLPNGETDFNKETKELIRT